MRLDDILLLKIRIFWVSFQLKCFTVITSKSSFRESIWSFCLIDTAHCIGNLFIRLLTVLLRELFSSLVMVSTTALLILFANADHDFFDP